VAIEFQRVTKTFVSPERLPVPVLRESSISIDEGTLTAIVGPSGAGKSTVAHLAAGLDTDYQGAILCFGSRLPVKEGPELYAHRASIGFVFQSLNLIRSLTALENVAFPLVMRGVAPSRAREAARLGLRSLALDHRGSSRPKDLSGGESQRVAIARALAAGNRVIIADEPTGHLDRDNEDLVLKALRLAVDEGRTVVIVTHSDRLAERSDRIIRVEGGRLEDIHHEAEQSAPNGSELQSVFAARRWFRPIQ